MLLAVLPAGAQQPSSLAYSGRIEIDGTPFSGEGLFSFAIVDSAGVILWASGEFPFVGKTNIPATALHVPVSNGNYTVRLGEAGGRTSAIDLSLVTRSKDPRLRIWFNDGRRGWNLIGNDVPLADALASMPSAAQGQAQNGDMAAIMRELRELRAKVDRQAAPAAPPREPPPQIVTVPIGHSPMMGDAKAQLVLVEFTDFQCPFCKRFNDAVMPDLKKNFVDTGKLRVVSRSMPLSFHANAPAAANAALCADAQQAFWPMREKIFANLALLYATNFIRYAEDLKLDVPKFTACLQSNAFSGQISQDSKDAESVNITGTPSFVLGRLNGDKVTGPLIIGARPYAAFESEINKLLAASK